MAVLLMQGAAWAQPAADTALLDMREAFRRNNAPTLTALLPRVRDGLRTLVDACPGHGALDQCPILAALTDDTTAAGD